MILGSISIGGYTDEELKRIREKREARENGGANSKEGVGSSQNNDDDSKNKNIENTKNSIATNEDINVDDNKNLEHAATKKEADPTTTVTKPNPSCNNKTSVVSSNAFASSSTTNSFNVLTDRPTSKVTRPPGGQTNWTL